MRSFSLVTLFGLSLVLGCNKSNNYMYDSGDPVVDGDSDADADTDSDSDSDSDADADSDSDSDRDTADTETDDTETDDTATSDTSRGDSAWDSGDSGFGWPIDTSIFGGSGFPFPDSGACADLMAACAAGDWMACFELLSCLGDTGGDTAASDTAWWTPMTTPVATKGQMPVRAHAWKHEGVRCEAGDEGCEYSFE